MGNVNLLSSSLAFLLGLVILQAGNSVSVSVVGAVEDLKSQERKILVNMITIDHGSNGTISRITNASQFVQGYDGIVKLLQNETAKFYSPDTMGVIINKATGTTSVTKDLNSTNYAIADEYIKTAGEKLNWVYFCWIEVVVSSGGIPTEYLICPGLIE